MRTPILIQESGYETDLNIRTVSRLGQKALIGDIPVILGGCHPASVISETEVVVFVIFIIWTTSRINDVYYCAGCASVCISIM